MQVNKEVLVQVVVIEFPSPYGVSFILIKPRYIGTSLVYGGFPSPYGVSFILIFFILSPFVF